MDVQGSRTREFHGKDRARRVGAALWECKCGHGDKETITVSRSVRTEDTGAQRHRKGEVKMQTGHGDACDNEGQGRCRDDNRVNAREVESLEVIDSFQY